MFIRIFMDCIVFGDHLQVSAVFEDALLFMLISFFVLFICLIVIDFATTCCVLIVY